MAVDIKTKKILPMKAPRENVSDSRMLKPLVEVPTQVSKVIADGAYDTKDNFRFLNRMGLNLPSRNNASFKSRGCTTRKLIVVQQLQDVKLWKTRCGYGMWWMAESAFSCIKRTFDEYVKSVRWKNMVNELLLKASIYNTFLSMSV